MFDLEKLRTIGFTGKAAGKVRVRTAGTSTEIDYADGRVEAVVRPPTTRRKVSVSTGEVVVDE